MKSKLVFVDASFYLSWLNSHDHNHQRARDYLAEFNHEYATSQAVLGEVLTVGSQRYSKVTTVDLVEQIIAAGTTVFLETKSTVDAAFRLFSQQVSKNISWVDCYSIEIMREYQIVTALSFDKDFARIAKDIRVLPKK